MAISFRKRPIKPRVESLPWAVLMKGVVEKLTNDDIVAISAYIASLEP